MQGWTHSSGSLQVVGVDVVTALIGTTVECYPLPRAARELGEEPCRDWPCRSSVWRAVFSSRSLLLPPSPRSRPLRLIYPGARGGGSTRSAPPSRRSKDPPRPW